MTRYVALLRGINVGGNRKVPMAELRASIEALGASDVRTYIQSGNVLFDGGRRSEASWVKRIEAAVTDRFEHEARIVLRSHAELRRTVTQAPRRFGAHPDEYRSDVLFLRGPTTATDVVAQLKPRDGVDRVAAGDGVVYFERLTARATQSALPRVIGLPVYQEMTIRNWRTTTTLLRMLDEVDR
ncbi:MAG TPA: DUF1697 domain-containing protein [Candidatus Limnocylindrales bacterium]|jgi:uncharacterized protein (DUF1697 family)|nr:DUF1697 domain-containing protein [Candidatus Limnocylindrales bacterium]